MPANASLIDYYARRANEYERIYQKPERQADLAVLKKLCSESLAGRDVLEIACGTGYWTHAASTIAKSITATDFNDEVLQIARTKKCGCEISFQQADAFHLGRLAKSPFTGGMAMAWWSHLHRLEIRKFLEAYHRNFAPGAQLIFMDNRFVPGSSTPISRTDADGNTYQLRRLDNGTEHEVLKNFPSKTEVKGLLAGLATEIRWTELPYYWFLTYRPK